MKYDKLDWSRVPDHLPVHSTGDNWRFNAERPLKTLSPREEFVLACYGLRLQGDLGKAGARHVVGGPSCALGVNDRLGYPSPCSLGWLANLHDTIASWSQEVTAEQRLRIFERMGERYLKNPKRTLRDLTKQVKRLVAKYK